MALTTQPVNKPAMQQALPNSQAQKDTIVTSSSKSFPTFIDRWREVICRKPGLLILLWAATVAAPYVYWALCRPVLWVTRGTIDLWLRLSMITSLCWGILGYALIYIVLASMGNAKPSIKDYALSAAFYWVALGLPFGLWLIGIKIGQTTQSPFYHLPGYPLPFAIAMVAELWAKRSGSGFNDRLLVLGMQLYIALGIALTWDLTRSHPARTRRVLCTFLIFTTVLYVVTPNKPILGESEILLLLDDAFWAWWTFLNVVCLSRWLRGSFGLPRHTIWPIIGLWLLVFSRYRK